METLSIHPLQDCWDNLLASVRADALRVALERRLFAALEQPLDAAAVAATQGWQASPTRALLDQLWSMGMLSRSEAGEGAYRNAPVAACYLHPQAPRYCGDALLFRLRTLRALGAQLENRLAGEVPAGPPPGGWAEAARVQIAQEQRAVTVDTALALMQRLEAFAGAPRLLDLGGGPGLVAIALARANPQLHGVVFDLSDSAAVARENIAAAGLGGRLEARGGDLLHDDLGSGYDLVWCSSVLHFMPDPPAALEKIHRALRPGGTLVCAHAEVPGQAADAARVLPYYLGLRMQGRYLPLPGELVTVLEAVGFEVTGQLPAVTFPLAPVTVQIARRR